MSVIFDFPEINEKLTEENKKLQMNCLEKQQQLEELDNHLKFYSGVRFQLGMKYIYCLLIFNMNLFLT